MQKIRFKAAVAVFGLFTAGQVAFAGTVSPDASTPEAAASGVTLAAHSAGGGGERLGGGGGGGGRGGSFASGGVGVSRGGINSGRAFSTGPRSGRGYVREGRGSYGYRRRGYGFAPFVGYGYNDTYYGGGSCYWNCRSSGYGPGYCRSYAVNFC